MKDIVIGCGLQYAYLNEDGSKYMGERSDVIQTRLKQYFKGLNKDAVIVYIIREVHRSDDEFFSYEKTSSTVGTADIHVPDFFKAYTRIMVNASRYNALYGTLLESEIYKNKPDRITLVGFETHTMILFTAEELRNRGYSVDVIEPLVTSQDDYLHAAGITLMRNFLGVNIETK